MVIGGFRLKKGWQSGKHFNDFSLMNATWAHFNIKTIFPRYGNYHVKDKMVLLIFNMGIPSIVKTTSLYRDGPLGIISIWLSFYSK